MPFHRLPLLRLAAPLLSLAVCLSVAVGEARAVPLVLSLDAAQSGISQGGGSAALAGTIVLELGALPPVGANTALAVTGLAVTGGGLSIGLDPGLANPGLGVLFPDGSFLIPSLHLSVSGDDLTVSNVTGTLAPDAACGGALCFLSGFAVDPGPGGIISVNVVAAVPEPARMALLGFLAIAIGALRRRGV